MKKNTLTLILFIFSAITSIAAPMYLPPKSITFTTNPIGNIPECSAKVVLDSDSRFVSQASLRIGDKVFSFPTDTLTGIEYPDLRSIRIETEKGMRGGVWYSIILSPARRTEHPTRFHISVVDGVFHQVTKTWHEPKEDYIRSHHEILYKNNESSNQAEHSTE